MCSRQASVLGWCFLLLHMAHGVAGGLPCIRKSFGRDSIVCVCNSTYCDTHDPVSLPPVGSFIKYESSKSGNRLALSRGVFRDRTVTPDLVLVLETTKQYQTVKGFGGSVTDAASINILSLTPATQNNLLRSYFSEDGIEYNMIRTPIGSCDFSTRTYSYADWPDDYELKNFSLVEEDIKMKVLSEDSEARRYIHGIGIHWYLDFIAPIEDTVAPTHELFPDYFLLFTEACTGSMFWEQSVVLGSWDRGNRYSRSILANLNHHVIGWVDWNLALDLEGGPNWVKNYVDSPIIVDVGSDTFYKQPMFYHMAHFRTGKTIPFGLSDKMGLIVTEIPPNSIQTYLWKRE